MTETRGAESPAEGVERNTVRTFLQHVRRRWFAVAALGVVARVGLAIAVVTQAALVIDWIRPLGGAGLLVLASVAAAIALAAAAALLWPLRSGPSDRQVARFVEEARPELEDRLVSAADVDVDGPFGALVLADATRRVRALDPRSIVSREVLRRSAARAVLAGLALIAVAFMARGPAGRAFDALRLYAFPSSVAIHVLPGDARVVLGQPVLISARLASISTDNIDGTRPTLIVDDGGEPRTYVMQPTGEGFALELASVTGDFAYRVSAGGAASEEYRIVALRPPTVARIDVTYDYPSFTGLERRHEEDGGDVYAPAGTNVTLRVHVTGDVVHGALTMADGTRLDLRGAGDALETALRVDGDGSYRVALVDRDGLSNERGMEYFIRMMNDRPPDVRIIRPAGDRQITSLEEVVIEARADDDYGIASFDLVYSVRGAAERVVPLGRGDGTSTATGRHTVYVEDLDVEPGDFITYYARARDVARAKRGSEARSDIFFLDVKPFEEEFVAAQSQAGGGGENSFQDLAAAQKAIIVATWKLERRAAGGRSAEDVGAIGQAQAELKQKTEEAAVAMSRPRSRRSSDDASSATDALASPLAAAAAAMGRAHAALVDLRTADALPGEMEALNQLLKAEAEIRRRQVARQQAQGSGTASGAQEDLSALFDRELQREQETNYETPQNAASGGQDRDSEALQRVRELARRQDELARQQHELARQREDISEEELRRRLERLTREQTELRQQAEELARQMATQRSQSSTGQGQSGGQSSGSEQAQGRQAGGDRMQEASEQMRRAASDLRRDDPAEAAARADGALAELRDLERELAGAQPGEQRRALGTLQLESRHVADAQRRVAQEARRVDARTPNADALRRLAGEKEKLADRVDALAREMETVGRNLGREGRQALDAAADRLEREGVSERMRESAADLRRLESGGAVEAADAARGTTADGSTRGREPGARPGGAGAAAERSAVGDLVERDDRLAQTLEDVARRVAGVGEGEGNGSRALSDQLRRLGDAKERLATLEGELDRLMRAGAERGADARGPGRPAGSGVERGAEGDAADTAERMANLEEAYRAQLNETLRMLAELQGPDAQGGLGRSTPERDQVSRSAPGTEAFKQDFAAWDELRRDVAQSLERLEASVSDRLEAEETDDRLNAGGDQRVPADYRELVSKYYEALAARTPD